MFIELFEDFLESDDICLSELCRSMLESQKSIPSRSSNVLEILNNLFLLSSQNTHLKDKSTILPAPLR